MALEPMVLAEGQLAASKTALYTVAVDDVAYIKTIALSNLHASALVAELYVKKSGGTARRFYHNSLAADETVILTSPLSLGPGDELSGNAATAALVDYMVTGALDTTNLDPGGFAIGWEPTTIDVGLAVTALTAP